MSRNGRVPDDWRESRLGEVASITMGQAPPGSAVNEDGVGLPFIQGNAEFGSRHPQPAKWCSDPWKRAQPGDVLLSVRAPVGALNIADVELAIGRGVSALRFEAIDPRFGWYAVQHGISQFERVSQGSTFEAIGRAEVAGLSLPVPPLPEQRKIAEILSSVDEAIERTEAVIERVRDAKRALAQELLTRGMPGRHTRYKRTEVGEIPEEWEVVRLGEVARIQSGIAKNEKAQRPNPVTLPYLRVANVQDGYIDLSEVKSITVDAADVPRCSLEPGDVLFTEGGDFDKLGRGAVWTAPISPCLHQNHVFAVRPEINRVMPEYLAMYAASQAGKRYFLKASKQTTNLASVNATQLGRLPLALPSVDEQKAIIGAVAAAVSRAEAESERLSQLRQVKATLSRGLLSGQIRMKADTAT